MTREEAIENLKWLLECSYVDRFEDEENEALEMAIQALEQEPCEDAISRQELLEDLYKRDYTKFTHRDFVALVQYQDTVQQEPKTGHWIKSRDCYGNYHFTCSECGNDIATQYSDNWEDKYCSECGCRMVEPQESEG